MNEAIKDFYRYYGSDDIFHEYLAFSKFIQSAFISKNGYIIGTGNFQSCNGVLMNLIKDKINKHPILWKIFFMVA